MLTRAHRATHTPAHAHTHTHTCTRSHMRMHAHSHMHARTRTHMHAHSYTHACAHTHTHTCARTHACTHRTDQNVSKYDSETEGLPKQLRREPVAPFRAVAEPPDSRRDPSPAYCLINSAPPKRWAFSLICSFTLSRTLMYPPQMLKGQKSHNPRVIQTWHKHFDDRLTEMLTAL